MRVILHRRLVPFGQDGGGEVGARLLLQVGGGGRVAAAVEGHGYGRVPAWVRGCLGLEEDRSCEGFLAG